VELVFQCLDELEDIFFAAALRLQRVRNRNQQQASKLTDDTFVGT